MLLNFDNMADCIILHIVTDCEIFMMIVGALK